MQRSQVGFLVITLLLCAMTFLVGSALAAKVVLDANPNAGFQGAVVVGDVQAGAVVALEVYGQDIEGATGFSANLNFDATQLTFSGFSAGTLIPGFTGLTLSEGTGKVEIGGASVEGASTGKAGRLGVVQFQVAPGFSGETPISITGAVLSTLEGSRMEGTSTVQVGGAPATQVAFDLDVTAGYQGAVSMEDLKAGDVVPIEVLGSNAAGATGFSATLTFDASKVSFDGFTAGALIPGFTGLNLAPVSGTVQIGGASVEGAATAASGQLGVVRFKLRSGFSGETEIQITGTSLARPDGTTDSTTPVTITLGAAAGTSGAKTPDFTGDGDVQFADFVQFAQNYGRKLGETAYDPRFDLNGNDSVDFGDFVLFAQAYGKPVASGKVALLPAGTNATALVNIQAQDQGDFLNARLSVSEIARLQGFDLVLQYDPAHLVFEGAQRPDESLLSQSGTTPLFLVREVSPGYVVIADVIADGALASGTGEIALVTFRRLAEGSGELKVDAVRLYDGDGGVDRLAAVRTEDARLVLDQNFPNPFNPQTQIAYSLTERSQVRLVVYNTAGQVVATLVDGVRASGQYRVNWNARNTSGQEVASGIYFYRLEAGGKELVRKMLLVK